jgi:hypothetical protein
MPEPARILGQPVDGLYGDDELIAKAIEQGVILSPAAVRAEQSKLLRRSGIHSPNEAQLATARRAAIEHLLLDVKALKEETP